MKNKKGLVVLLAAVALLTTVGTSLAYWASSVTGNTGNATGTVKVGTGDAVTTTVNVSNYSESKLLVPAGYADDLATETDSVSMVFPVAWVSDVGNAASGAVGTLTVTQTLTVGGVADTYELVNVSLPADVSITADAPAISVTVIVTLKLPANQAQYDAVVGKTILITFSFTVA